LLTRQTSQACFGKGNWGMELQAVSQQCWFCGQVYDHPDERYCSEVCQTKAVTPYNCTVEIEGEYFELETDAPEIGWTYGYRSLEEIPELDVTIRIYMDANCEITHQLFL
jgi:hypothetical protein